MEHTRRTVSELSSLFRMIQVIPDADNIGRIYQMLLAFCTTWRTIGFQRGFLFLVEDGGVTLRGQLAAERAAELHDELDAQNISFEALAKNVFDNFEQIEASDLTLRTRTFSVPMDGQRSAVVKAAANGYPVLAESRMSEFETDPFFEFFGAARYIAVPIKVGDRVQAVLAADNGVASDKPIGVDDVSLVYSLSQQASLAVERLIEANDNRRKFRILRKLQDTLRRSKTQEELSEALNLALSMICRACDGSGAILKDFVRNRTLHVKTLDEVTVDASEADISVSECFDEILTRCAGGIKPIGGDDQYPLLNEVAAARVRFFYASPLVVTSDSLGALSVYVEKLSGNRGDRRFDLKNRTFIELCAGMIGDRLNALYRMQRVARAEAMVEEVRSNLIREKQGTRLGAMAMARFDELVEEIEDLRELMGSRLPYEKRVARAREKLTTIEQLSAERKDELVAMKSALEMVDLFALVRGVVENWKPKVIANGVEVTVRIPARGPSLLMSRENITIAIDSTLRTLTGAVVEGNKVLVECSVSDDRAVITVADTGVGLPGNLLSRLFMPFAEVGGENETRNTLSVAADILGRHGAEIRLSSSPSWKTVLVITFPCGANKDRRGRRPERRRRAERRS